MPLSITQGFGLGFILFVRFGFLFVVFLLGFFFPEIPSVSGTYR